MVRDKFLTNATIVFVDSWAIPYETVDFFWVDNGPQLVEKLLQTFNARLGVE